MKSILLAILTAIFLCGCAQTEVAPTTQAPSLPDAAVTEAETEPSVSIAETTAPSVPETTLPPADPLEELVKSMSIEELAGQMFLARCPDADAVSELSRCHLGGYILFGRDFDAETPDSIRQTLTQYQQAASIPMLIAVDEEGGTVTRVSSEPAFRDNAFPSPRDLYETGGEAAVLDAELEKSQLLHSLGINANMAPVCDVCTDPDAFMYDRSLGLEPELTGSVIASMVQVMSREQVGSVLKHFPGYGNNTDTHVAMATDERTLDDLEQVDLVPFRAGIAAGCDAIMVSHTIVTALDGDLPASLSPAVHAYLRNQMDFDGVIVTDDLSMQAIADYYGTGEAAVLAVLAGNDLLCSTYYDTQYEAIVLAAEEGRIPREYLENSALRILRWKDRLGLLSAVYVTLP